MIDRSVPPPTTQTESRGPLAISLGLHAGVVLLFALLFSMRVPSEVPLVVVPVVILDSGAGIAGASGAGGELAGPAAEIEAAANTSAADAIAPPNAAPSASSPTEVASATAPAVQSSSPVTPLPPVDPTPVETVAPAEALTATPPPAAEPIQQVKRQEKPPPAPKKKPEPVRQETPRVQATKMDPVRPVAVTDRRTTAGPPAMAPAGRGGTAPVIGAAIDGPGTPGQGSGSAPAGPGPGRGNTGTNLASMGEGRSLSDGDFLDRLRRHLQPFARRSYPGDAVARREEGTVEVLITVGDDGSVLDARIEKGSGYPSLDRAALAAVRNASPLPRPPEHRAGGAIVFPVHYTLGARIF